MACSGMKFLIILIQNCKYSLLYFYLALYSSTHGIILMTLYVIFVQYYLFNLFTVQLTIYDYTL